jgi:solute carrier family 25 phosphate transporter 23/24/25/41
MPRWGCSGHLGCRVGHGASQVSVGSSREGMPSHAGMTNALTTVVRTEGVVALYKGLLPTLIGIAPYAALNFATYDLLKQRIYHGSLDK